MAKIEQYRTYIQHLMKKHASQRSFANDVEMQGIIDLEGDHYQLVSVGWHKDKRIHHCIVHIDIKDQKIWIQQDYTETGIANELIELGIPKADIVLAFHAPYKRHFTGFATA